MQAVILAALALILAGCASPRQELSSPVYDHDSQMIVADGYPIEALATPNGFEIAAYPDQPGFKVFTFADDNARFIDVGYMLSPRAKGQYGSDSPFDGQDRIDGLDVFYQFEGGPYDSVIADASLAPTNAPGCAAAIALAIARENSPGVMIATYIVEAECSAQSDPSPARKHRLKVQAYNLLGIH